jgi:cytochrome c-type biogenesis protein CcmH
MTTFVLIAIALTLAVIALVVYPLVFHKGAAPAAGRSALVFALLCAGGAGLLYPVWSKWNWNAPATAPDSPAAMVGRLARKMEKEPGNLEGWLMLGRSYAVIEQYPASARAYQRANLLANGKNADALTGLAEALVLSEQSDLGGRAGRLFEDALALDPGSTKALFYSAIAALERGDNPLARERFVKLLSGNPPPEVRRIIEEQVRRMDGTAQVATAPGAPVANAPANATANAAASAPPRAATVVAVPLRITLDGKVAGKAQPGAPLFVLARIPGQRGPPLAAKRLEARFPQELELLSSDAMIAGSGFTAGQEIEVEARIANGGSAISRSGDPFGVVTLKAGAGARATVEINQVKP